MAHTFSHFNWSSLYMMDDCNQGRRSWGLGGPDPLKICRGQSMFWLPWKCHSFIRNLLYNCKFHNIKDEHLDTITSLILLMPTMLPSLCLISSKQTVSSNQCLCCSTGLKLSWPKTNLQNVGGGDPSSTILIDHGSHAVLPTADRLQLGWLTRGAIEIWLLLLLLDPVGGEVLTSPPKKKICRKGPSMFWPH